MMKIKHVEIRNLRGIDHLELDLTGPDNQPLDLVMLAGPNGCGKTTVLEACLWAIKQEKRLPLRPVPSGQQYEIILTLRVEDEDVRIVRNPQKTRVYHWHDDGWHSGILGKSDPLRAVSTFYFSSWRAPTLVGSVGLTLGPGRRPAETERNSLWRLKQYLVNLKGASSFKAAKQDIREPFEKLNQVWKNFYPERNGRFEAAVYPDEPPAGDRKPKDGPAQDASLAFDLFYFDEKHPQGIPVDDLSSGEIEILSMAGSFMLNKQGYDIVFVDEPELHLHPAWHRSIMRALRLLAPNSQLICATHSEEIMESVYSYERFTILEEDDPRVRLFMPPDENGAAS